MSGSSLAAPRVRFAASRSLHLVAGGWYAAFQHLSLDIVLGVVCAAAFAVAATGARMPPCWWVLLPLATWVVYSADHLLDARRTGARAQQSRHRFFHRRFALLAAVTLVLLLAGALAGVVLLPAGLRLPAVLAGLGAVIHLALAQRASRAVAKEFSSATVYVAGIWFGPLLLAPGAGPWAFVLAGLHLVAALTNLIAFALFEERFDALDDQPSIVRSWGRPAARRLLAGLTAVGACGASAVALLGPAGPPAAAPILLLLIVTPGIMVLHREAFVAGQRYRVVGDLAFVLMVVPFWLAGPR